MGEDRATGTGEEALVGEDIRCASCGYNLRTLSRRGRCPECGAAVVESLVRRPFRGASRDWLLLVAVGLGLLLIASVLMVWALVLHKGRVELLEMAFTIGPGAPKAGVAADLVRGGDGRALALVSLLVHSLGVVLVMWPMEPATFAARLKTLTLIAIATGTLLVAILVAEGWRGNWRYHRVLPWLLLLDAWAMIMMNLRIAEIAARGLRRRSVIAMWWLTGAQLAGFLLLVAAIVFGFDRVGLSIADGGGLLQAAGATGASAISLWLIAVLMLRRKGL